MQAKELEGEVTQKNRTSMCELRQRWKHELIDVPRDVIVRMTEFLDVSDAVRFSLSCRTLYMASPLATLSPHIQLLPAKQFFGEYRDRHRKGPEIPVILGSRTHSIILRTSWRDQGYGPRKGGLFIVAHNRDKSENVDDFSQGRLVKASPITPHRVTQLMISFQPRANEVYHLWLHVGSGGGHELEFTTPLLMHTVVYDTEKRSLSRAFGNLRRAAIVPAPGANNSGDFWPGLLQAAAQSLIGQLQRKEEPDPFLSKYLESNGFEIDRHSLQGLLDLCSRFGNNSLQSQRCTC